MKVNLYFSLLTFAVSGAFFPRTRTLDLPFGGYMRVGYASDPLEEQYARVDDWREELEERRRLRAKQRERLSKPKDEPQPDAPSSDEVNNLDNSSNLKSDSSESETESNAKSEGNDTSDQKEDLLTQIRNRQVKRKKEAEDAVKAKTGGESSNNVVQDNTSYDVVSIQDDGSKPESGSSESDSEATTQEDSSNLESGSSDTEAESNVESQDADASDEKEDLLTRIRNRHAKRKKEAEDAAKAKSGDESADNETQENASDDTASNQDDGSKPENDSSEPDSEATAQDDSSNLDSNSSDTEAESSDASNDSNTSDANEDVRTRIQNRLAKYRKVYDDTDENSNNEDQGTEGPSNDLKSGGYKLRALSDRGSSYNDLEERFKRFRDRHAQRM